MSLSFSPFIHKECMQLTCMYRPLHEKSVELDPQVLPVNFDTIPSNLVLQQIAFPHSLQRKLLQGLGELLAGLLGRHHESWQLGDLTERSK